MTTPAAATGGKVWEPDSSSPVTFRARLVGSFKGLRNYPTTVGTIVGLIGVTAVILFAPLIFPARPTPTETLTNPTLTITSDTPNPDQTIQQWASTQMGYAPEQVAQTYSGGMADGSVGVIRLTDGTLHSYTLHRTGNDFTLTPETAPTPK